MEKKANAKIKLANETPLDLYWTGIELVKRKQRQLDLHRVVADILPLLNDEDYAWLIGHPYQADRLCQRLIAELVDSCSPAEKELLSYSLDNEAINQLIA